MNLPGMNSSADEALTPSEDAPAAPSGNAGIATSIEITGDERRRRQSKIDAMRDLFAAMPKVRVRVPEDTRVQINGYTFNIKAKTSVLVPELVAEVLEQSGKI